MNKVKRFRSYFSFLIAFLFVVLFAVLIYFNTSILLRKNRILKESYSTMEVLDQVYGKMLDVEAGGRGFVLTGSESYLEYFMEARSTVMDDARNTIELTQRNPKQSEYALKMFHLLDEKMKYTDHYVDLRKKNGYKDALNEVKKGNGELLKIEISSLINKIKVAEYQEIDYANNQLVWRAQVIILTILLVSLIFVGLIYYTFMVYRRNTEAIMKAESETKFQGKLFKDISDSVISINRQGVVNSWNDSAEKTFKIRKSDAVGQEIEILAPKWDILGKKRNFSVKRTLLNEGSVTLNSTIIMAGGVKRHFLSSLTLLRDKKGRRNGMILVNKDITESKEASDKLLSSEERFRVMVESVKDYAMIMFDKQGNVSSWNDGATRVFGYSQKTGCKLGVSDLFPESENSVNSMGKLSKLLGEAERYEKGVQMIKNSGQIFPAHIVFKSIKGTKKQTLGFVILIHDLTNQTKTEERIRRLDIELENRVKERTMDLEKANEELEAFSYSAAHDLRSPLNNIRSILQLIRDHYQESMNENLENMFSMVQQRAEKMDLLIKELLSLSKIGNAELRISEVDIFAIIKQVIKDYASKEIGFKGRLVIKDILPTMGDAFLIEQVFINLISNAVKYSSEKESPVIEIFCEEADGEIVYRITDNGAGFDPGKSEKLFEPFQRLHTQAQFEGIGLGLTIVKRIIEKHGGRVWAQGKPGEGSCFSFSIPNEMGSGGKVAA
jgi:PAS domain S-box-containing protein